MDIIRAEWPDGIPLVEATIDRVVELNLNLDWAAKHLLMAPALAEYKRITAPALAEYKRITAPALAEYERITAPALAEYKRIMAQTLLRLLTEAD